MQETVLIVDDEAGLRGLLKRWLSENYLVMEAPSAEEALEVLGQSAQIAVVVADLDMPGNGGAWLVNEMRRHYPSTVIVLATADGNVPGTVSLQSSVVGYLVKPLKRDELLELVATAVDRAKGQAQQSGGRRSAADPIEGFLDRKLIRGNWQ